MELSTKISKVIGWAKSIPDKIRSGVLSTNRAMTRGFSSSSTSSGILLWTIKDGPQMLANQAHMPLNSGPAAWVIFSGKAFTM
eukprot:5946334-Prorocentrum_lima.AAC.1